MLGFVEKIFVSAMMLFGCNISNINSLKCVSMSNWQCKIRPGIINSNSNEPSFYPYSVKININEVVVVIISMIHIQKMCVSDVVKNINVKVFNLITRNNETRHIQ